MTKKELTEHLINDFNDLPNNTPVYILVSEDGGLRPVAIESISGNEYEILLTLKEFDNEETRNN